MSRGSFVVAVSGSIALVGFGLDSVVEVASGLIILWQFRHPVPESRERQALRAIAISFLALAAYIAVESTRALITQDAPDGSRVGIGLTIASLLIMPVLSTAQRRTGRALNSNAVVADGTQTPLCTYLSAVLLLGLLLNATLGWFWIDPVAALIIAVVAAREGVQAWQGKGCCSTRRRRLLLSLAAVPVLVIGQYDLQSCAVPLSPAGRACAASAQRLTVRRGVSDRWRVRAPGSARPRSRGHRRRRQH
ncbi:cation transporter [Kribbella amoyensis]|uniref:cation transporter n=1 Tax=Kribbella amoyensis TaxID=996641 RepID=UPI0011A87E1D|nr:cation transporter [Kribbella amoyensis]